MHHPLCPEEIRYHVQRRTDQHQELLQKSPGYPQIRPKDPDLRCRGDLHPEHQWNEPGPRCLQESKSLQRLHTIVCNFF